jgi:hypothetical protein
VGVAAAPAPRLQWQFEDLDIPGATSEVLVLSNARPTQAGSYRVVISNEVGVVTSRPATLTLLAGAPFFDEQPENRTVVEGTNVALSVHTGGPLPVSYQWRRNEIPIANATNSMLL